jgi:hypothetical protein
MIQAGFTFEHPLTKTKTVVLESAAETNGMGWLLEISRTSKRDRDIGEHLHQTWTETFEIISGSANYSIDGKEHTANAGESFAVEPGHFHIHPWNATDEKLVYRQRNRFAKPDPEAIQDILGILATQSGMIRDRALPKTKFAKLMLQAVTARRVIKHGSYLATPSISVQRWLGWTVGLFGELLGYKAILPKYIGE